LNVDFPSGLISQETEAAAHTLQLMIDREQARPARKIYRERTPEEMGWFKIAPRKWTRPDGSVYEFPPTGAEIIMTFENADTPLGWFMANNAPRL
jgi:hypothetical protein